MDSGKDYPSANTGGGQVTTEEKGLLAKLLDARNRGAKKLNPDELQTIREANKKFKPVGRSVSEPISEN